MTFSAFLGLAQTSLELGLINALTVLSLFLSYSMLNVCDLSTDGCFTLGAAVGAVVAVAGHPYLSIPAAMLAGVLSGLVTAVIQTRMGINSLLAGIIVNTALYSVNMVVMGGSAQVNIFKSSTVFTLLQDVLKDTPFAGGQKLIIAAVAVALAIWFLSAFLKTRMGLAIRATGDNPDMVRASSISPAFTTTVGLCLSNALTGLSGCLLAQQGSSANIDIGSGMVTTALASLLIGGVFTRKCRSIPLRALGAVLGSFIFRLVYAIALRFKVPSTMFKAVSAIIVVLCIFIPYFKTQWPMLKRKLHALRGTRKEAV